MFDDETLREEMAALEEKLKKTPGNGDLLNRYVLYARKLRAKEYAENGYVASRSSVTGY